MFHIEYQQCYPCISIILTEPQNKSDFVRVVILAGSCRPWVCPLWGIYNLGKAAIQWAADLPRLISGQEHSSALTALYLTMQFLCCLEHHTGQLLFMATDWKLNNIFLLWKTDMEGEKVSDTLLLTTLRGTVVDTYVGSM